MKYLCLLLLLCLGWPAQAGITLPQPPQAVVDLVGTVDNPSRQVLYREISQLEREQGWQVRVLVQKDQIPGRQIKQYWNLGARSVLIVMDLKGNNPLFFNIGDQVQRKLPRLFWQELQARYGNQYYIGEHGRGAALVATFGAIAQSLREGGRATVPGLSQEHWLLTFLSSMLGGLVAGFAVHPRRPGAIWHWQGLLFSAPLWSILFVIFGLGVVRVRTDELLPLLENIGGFTVAALIAFLIPTPKRAKLEW